MSEVTVTIFNHTYRLAVTAGEEELLKRCAQAVDEQMSAVQASGKVIALDQIAVLTALELAYDAQKQKDAAARSAPPAASSAPAAVDAARAQESAAAPAAPLQTEPAAAPEQPAPAVQPPQAAEQPQSAPVEDEAAILDELRSLCRLCEEAIYKDAVLGMRL